VQHFLSFNQPLGRVIIKYCEPLSLAQFIKDHSAKNGLKFEDYQKDQKVAKQLVNAVGAEISLIQTDNLVVMSTPLVASILLMHRRGIS